MRRPLPSWVLAAAALVAGTLLLVSGGVAQAEDWEKLSEQGGVLIERRAVAGSSLSEIRATILTSLPPALVAQTLWNHRDYPHFVPHLKRLEILSERGDERLTYEQVSVPLLSDRDYTVRVRRRADPAAQRYEISFESDNAAGPPPDPHYVRVARIRGKWTVEPAPGSPGSLVRYQVQAEGGGSIPDWLANRAQRAAASDLVRAVLERAQDSAGAK
jgi:ribosome-associated toxin RatA of RatAB toxin-antitoxin module